MFLRIAAHSRSLRARFHKLNVTCDQALLFPLVREGLEMNLSEKYKPLSSPSRTGRKRRAWSQLKLNEDLVLACSLVWRLRCSGKSGTRLHQPAQSRLVPRPTLDPPYPWLPKIPLPHWCRWLQLQTTSVEHLGLPADKKAVGGKCPWRVGNTFIQSRHWRAMTNFQSRHWRAMTNSWTPAQRFGHQKLKQKRMAIANLILSGIETSVKILQSRTWRKLGAVIPARYNSKCNSRRKLHGSDAHISLVTWGSRFVCPNWPFSL